MPRFPDEDLNVAVYIYPTVDAARKGEEAGGTGFIVCKPFDRVPGRGVLCVVTNKHVVQRGASVPRLNRLDGASPDCIDLGPHDWFPHRGQCDLTLAVGVANEGVHNYKQVLTTAFVTPQIAKDHNIGAGDDVLMVGRFIGHDGKVHNEPSVRFGNVSAGARPMMNSQAGYAELSYAVEMKSKPGYSGSPVFVYGTSISNIFVKVHRPRDKQDFMYLLGVNWGQIQEKRPLEANGKDVPGAFVKEASGMNGVVPAWRILEIFDQPEVKAAIKPLEDRDYEIYVKRRASTDPAAEPPKAENPNHEEDFTALLAAAARKPK